MSSRRHDDLCETAAWHRHPELAEAAGGVCVTGDASGHVETLSLADLVAARPDVVIFGPCGFHMARSVKDLREAAWLQSPGAAPPPPPSLMHTCACVGSKRHSTVFTSAACLISMFLSGHEAALPRSPACHCGGCCGAVVVLHVSWTGSLWKSSGDQQPTRTAARLGNGTAIQA